MIALIEKFAFLFLLFLLSIYVLPCFCEKKKITFDENITTCNFKININIFL